MKRLTCPLILFLALITCARAQVITITFEGTLNAAPITLDSILVMNLTAGGDTTIYFPDNVLELGVTGINEVATKAPVLRNQPNPFAGATDVLVCTRSSGQALMTVNDATGREVAVHAGNLAAGQHRFRYTAASPGVHLLTVWQGGERATHRLVALAGERNAAGFTYVGSNSTGGTAKADRSLFTWTPGDELRYIGYATSGAVLHSAAIDEVPMSTATRTFELFAGLACPESPTVTDIEGNVYRTVQIGGRCWMAENLRTTRYRDGSSILLVQDNTLWSQLGPAWCVYGNNSDNAAIYGHLYNWYTATSLGLCPLGWHVPADSEWQQLEIILGVPFGELAQTGYRGEVQNVGGRMKTTELWFAPNTGATNESGFLGRPGGARYGNDWGIFDLLGFNGNWWSASAPGSYSGWSRNLDYEYAGIGRFTAAKSNGYCVRCIRD